MALYAYSQCLMRCNALPRMEVTSSKYQQNGKWSQQMKIDTNKLKFDIENLSVSEDTRNEITELSFDDLRKVAGGSCYYHTDTSNVCDTVLNGDGLC